MSDLPADYADRLDLRGYTARIDQQLAETRTFQAEQARLSADQSKLAAEQLKLVTEAAKPGRDRFLAPAIALAATLAATLAAIATVVPFILRAAGR